MGRLSTFAKNRILNLRFQKSYRIKQIALSLQQEDDIKVSRKSISTFLKKYIETKSIHDKPRSGRNKKLTPEEINLIGEITRLNRDITAPKIKEYLNLNVSTYTILRASKLFEWNKLNPNSNEAKKAAALKRQLNGEIKRRKNLNARSRCSTPKASSHFEECQETEETNEFLKNALNEEEIVSLVQCENNMDKEMTYDFDLKLLSEQEILNAKNASSSAMVFATKILYKIFHLDELLGHNVSGKTFNKYIKNKKALDQKRIYYIKWLVESYFETNNKKELWKSCRTAINKSIRKNEIKGGLISGGDFKEDKNLLNNLQTTDSNEPSSYNIVDLSSNIINESIYPSSMPSGHMTMCNDVDQSQTTSLLNLEPNMSIFQMSNELPNLDLVLNKQQTENSTEFKCSDLTSVVTLTDPSDLVGQFIHDENKTFINLKNNYKKIDCLEDSPQCDLQSPNNLNILPEHKIIELKNLYCSPMIFATKVLVRIFTKAELLGHSIGVKTLMRQTNQVGNSNKTHKTKQPLDEDRINYIQWLVNTYFNYFNEEKQEAVWKSCRKAINRVIRNIEIKESKLIKSCDHKSDQFAELNQFIEFNDSRL